MSISVHWILKQLTWIFSGMHFLNLFSSSPTRNISSFIDFYTNPNQNSDIMKIYLFTVPQWILTVTIATMNFWTPSNCWGETYRSISEFGVSPRSISRGNVDGFSGSPSRGFGNPASLSQSGGCIYGFLSPTFAGDGTYSASAASWEMSSTI